MKYKKFQVSELGFNNFFTILSHLIYTGHLFHNFDGRAIRKYLDCSKFDIKNVQKARVNIFFKCIDFLLPSIPHFLFFTESIKMNWTKNHSLRWKPSWHLIKRSSTYYYLLLFDEERKAIKTVITIFMQF